MPARIGLAALLVFAVAVGGCLGGGTDTTSPEPSVTADGTDGSTPADPVLSPEFDRDDFHDGPRDRPERPETLNASTVRKYVRTHEYRHVYNGLYMGEHTDVDLDCRIDNVTERSWGYDVVVTCTGYADVHPPADSTATPVHADYFTQSFRYSVSENVTKRVSVANRR